MDFRNLTEQLERVHSPRLALRPVALSDSWPLYQATRNPLFNRHLLWDQPADDALLLDRMDAIVDSARRARMTALSAVVKTTGEWVSLFRFQPHAQNPENVEMGVWTHDKFWHGRYSLELGRICVDAAFALSDISTLIGAASPDNKSSCKLMELCGLIPTKLVCRPTESGSEVELQEFQITRDIWAATRRQPAFQQVPVRAPLVFARPRPPEPVVEIATRQPSLRGIASAFGPRAAPRRRRAKQPPELHAAAAMASSQLMLPFAA